MNKAELITELASKQNLTQRLANEIINLIFRGFTESLLRGEKVEIRGFGVFSVRGYKSHDGWNPKSGRKILLKPKRLPYFKAGKEMKEKVNSRGNLT